MWWFIGLELEEPLTLWDRFSRRKRSSGLSPKNWFVCETVENGKIARFSGLRQDGNPQTWNCTTRSTECHCLPCRKWRHDATNLLSVGCKLKFLMTEVWAANTFWARSFRSVPPFVGILVVLFVGEAVIMSHSFPVILTNIPVLSSPTVNCCLMSASLLY